MTLIEAARLALEALEEISSHYMSLPKKGCMALAAIEEVLAQPEQEPERDSDCKEADGCPTEKAVLQRFWREAQQQEPVAWMWRCKPYCDWPDWSVSLKRPADSGRDGHKRTEGYEDMPLYTTPPQRTWQGLTDEELAKTLGFWEHTTESTRVTLTNLARAIEAKLKEKNT